VHEKWSGTDVCQDAASDFMQLSGLEDLSFTEQIVAHYKYVLVYMQKWPTGASQ
jgi:hypothetical protein